MDSSSGSVTSLQSPNDTRQILAGHKEDSVPVDLTALLRHHYGTEFTALATVWPKLPDNIKSAILALAAVKP